ncbi:RNA 2',3'-cyclic phosphodiesterase [Anaerobacillus sp. HL2]|nr:RNA 2',3'-cyclic phosphodiesterase [Anaerobacillus sp. HL2]
MTNEAHYFIAVPIKSSLKEKLAKWNEKERPPFQRFVDQEDYHITLAFLGGVEPAIMSHLQVNLRKVSTKHEPFPLCIDDLGFFGQKQVPRSFGLVSRKEEKLFELQKDVFQTCVHLGFEMNKRKYSPHIHVCSKVYRKWSL